MQSIRNIMSSIQTTCIPFSYRLLLTVPWSCLGNGPSYNLVNTRLALGALVLVCESCVRRLMSSYLVLCLVPPPAVRVRQVPQQMRECPTHAFEWTAQICFCGVHSFIYTTPRFYRCHHFVCVHFICTCKRKHLRAVFYNCIHTQQLPAPFRRGLACRD